MKHEEGVDNVDLMVDEFTGCLNGHEKTIPQNWNSVANECGKGLASLQLYWDLWIRKRNVS